MSAVSLRHHLLLLLLSLSVLHFGALAAPNPDLAPLQAFRSSAASAGGAALASWVPSGDPCSGDWVGISCRGGRVSGVVLEGLGLDGPLDPLARLPRLHLLSIKNNSFSAPLHRLDLSPWRPHIKLLYLSRNRFSGPFPAGLLLLRRLRRLDLAGNLFAGSIPPDIGLRLPHLLTLHLEGNLFTGAVPASLEDVAGLYDLNVSYNRLVGEIPGAVTGFPASSFVGNPGLCGPPLLRRCPDGTAMAASVAPNSAAVSRKKTKLVVVVVAAAAIAILALAVLMAFAALLLCRKRRQSRTEGNAERGGRDGGKRERRGDDGGKEERSRLVFFEGCEEFLLEDLMKASAEMLGRGAVGTTYRVVMDGGEPEAGGVVVKRVRRDKMAKKDKRDCAGAEERLLGEIGGWRHPNVVSLRAYYSSDDELLLVFDYLPNGSLHSLLHGNRGPGRTPVEWATRMKIAQDAAKGLAFLHGASKSKLSHLNLTSSNILLDGEGNACISDFAVHQLLPPSSPSPGVPTTCSKKRCDVYSFGVVLLEILTGRADGENEVDLARWVQTVVKEEWTSEVFDLELVGYKEMEDEMVTLLQVALLCLAPEPKDRPRMSVVCKMIEDIRERGSRRGRGSHSHSPSLNGHSYESSSPSLSEDTPTFASS